MKWAERIDIIVSSLLVFLVSILLSYYYKDKEWLPEFLMMIAGAALSVVIVLKIIEVWSRRERLQRWEKVRLLIYSRFLHEFRGITLLSLYYTSIIENYVLNEDSLSCFHLPILENFSKPDKLAMLMRELATNLKQVAFEVMNFQARYYLEHEVIPKDHIKSKLFQKTSENFIYPINECRNLIPRTLDLSDDEELGLELHKFENECNVLISIIRQQELEASDLMIILRTISVFLNSTADLSNLIQRKLTKPEQSWIEKAKLKIKFWWLPPSFWE